MTKFYVKCGKIEQGKFGKNKAEVVLESVDGDLGDDIVDFAHSNTEVQIITAESPIKEIPTKEINPYSVEFSILGIFKYKKIVFGVDKQ